MQAESNDSVLCVSLLHTVTEAGRVLKAALTTQTHTHTPLLACFSDSGLVKVCDLSEYVTAGRITWTQAAGTHTQCVWEAGGSRFLTVGLHKQLTLYETSKTLLCSATCSAEAVLGLAQTSQHSLSDLESLQLVCFSRGRSFVLINQRVLMQLAWPKESSTPECVSVCSLQLPAETSVCGHGHICEGMFFMLSTHTPNIYVFECVEGQLLADVDLSISPASMSEVGVATLGHSPSYCLFHVSHNLSTLVAVTCEGSALALDLHDYFSTHSSQLLYRASQSETKTCAGSSEDQDSVLTSNLGASLHPDRSWEAQLSNMYTKALSQSRPAFCSSWFRHFPHMGCVPSAVCAELGQACMSPGGAVFRFEVPEGAIPVSLAVSQYSAMVTYVSSQEDRATVALWDIQSGSVTHHQLNCRECVPVTHTAGEDQAVLLTEGGVNMVLFGVSQEELLNRLMVFGSAATVDSLCHLNGWGRCSIPIHALQAGLKNHQLDTVDFFLKSKQNFLVTPVGFGAAEAPSLTYVQLHNMQELCPALDLLCSAIRDTHAESQSRQFAEQLLNITLTFLYTQVRSLLCSTPELDGNLQSCVDILDSYISELRVYMKRFVWLGGAAASVDQTAQEDEWQGRSTQELVALSVAAAEIPRAQAVLRSKQQEHKLPGLKAVGLSLAFQHLRRRELQPAVQLLRNMGFHVKEQLHRISLHTSDSGLRDFLVKELLKQNFLCEEEVVRVDFIRQVEQLGSVSATRCQQTVKHSRFLQLSQSQSEWWLPQNFSLPAESLWSCVRLVWVKHWDTQAKANILLSRLQDSALSSCDATQLWTYLTILHDSRRIHQWLATLTVPSEQLWPVLSADVVKECSSCSRYLQDQILDQLAQLGLFAEAELSSLELLLRRVASAGGVMQEYELQQNFHSKFIQHCLQHSLRYVLYSYTQHYRLNEGSCSSLSDQSLCESHPWLEMLLRVQEVSRSLTDAQAVFHASLANAQMLTPGSQASISSLLMEGHSLLALATIMFSPGGIDQVVCVCPSGKRHSLCQLDLQLLKIVLVSYPKLRAALFPQHSILSEPSFYQLLQALHPLDSSKLFHWQAANPVGGSDELELPHFSSAHLVARFAQVQSLDFLYFLQHGRPAMAYGTFLQQQLGGNSSVPVQTEVAAAASQACALAMQCFHSPHVAAAASCFCELLGCSSLRLRVCVSALRLVLHFWAHTQEKEQMQESLEECSRKLALQQGGATQELLLHLEEATEDAVHQKGVERCSYEASGEWMLVVQFCRLQGLPLTCMYLHHCAADSRWLHFLLFLQMHKYPLAQAWSLMGRFSPALQAHLSLAFRPLLPAPQQEGEEPVCQRPPDLFQVLLQSQAQEYPWRHLLAAAVRLHCPLLSVLAASHQGTDLIHCLCVWLLTSVDDVIAQEATAHISGGVDQHRWSLHDLSVMWKTLLGKRIIRPLIRGFHLFQKDCPLLLMLHMYELCCEHKNFPQAQQKLVQFQSCLLNLKSSSTAAHTLIPLHWAETQASVLLLTLLQQSSTQYELRHVLCLLAEVDHLLKPSGPDFRKLSVLSKVLQNTPLPLSLSLLQSCTVQQLQKECSAVMEQLQDLGLFSQAREVAELAELPIDSVLVNKMLQDLRNVQAMHQWARQETRVAFWMRCHQRFVSSGASTHTVCRFFRSQAEHSSLQDEEVLLCAQERALLLALAGHWMLRGRTELEAGDLTVLQELEHKFWWCQVKQQVLQSGRERQSVFVSPAGSRAFDEALAEFSFSKVAVLNRAEHLCVETLPPEGQGAESVPEREALDTIVAKLLDEGRVAEASRLCRYFSFGHRDLELVLKCRALASRDKEEDVTQLQEGAERASNRSLTSCSSLSSLSTSYVVQPEDCVALQLQALADVCQHGRTYCKQVLSLYELSKELCCSYSGLSAEKPQAVLCKVLQSHQPDRCRKARAFVCVQALPADTVAQLVAQSVLQELLSPAQESMTGRPIYSPAEGKEAFLQLAKLCGDANLVGTKLLDLISTVPVGELSCTVELLILAHECFSLTCNMEGIVRVLQAARHLSHTHLAHGEHYGLLVRLLTGIGRYNDMTYIFDLLNQNHRFEMLLRKKVESNSTLKTALLDYLKRCLPGDSEKHNMVALCFSMCREIGENHEVAARTQLKLIESQPWFVSTELKNSLVKVLTLLKDAAESYSKDSCVRQAARCVRLAKLVTLQLHVINQGLELQVINLCVTQLEEAALALPRCYQALVLAEAYDVTLDWAEILFQKVVLGGQFGYLEEFKQHRPLPATMFEEISQKCQDSPAGSSRNLKKLLQQCQDVYTHYRLAYQHKLYDVANVLLQDSKTSSYLSDRLSG